MIIGLLGQKGVGKDTAGAVLAKELGGVCIAFADPIKRFFLNAFGLTERQLWGDLKEKPVTAKQWKALRRYLPYTEGSGSPFKRLPRSWKDKYERPVKTLLADAFTEACCVELRSKTYGEADLEGKIRVWLRDVLKGKARKKVTPRYLMQQFGTEFVRQNLGERFWVDTANRVSRALLDDHDYDRAQGLAKRHGGADAVVITDLRFRNEVRAVKAWNGKVYRIERPSKTNKHKHASEAQQLSIPNWWCDRIVQNDGTKEQFEARIRRLAIEGVKKMLYFPDPRFKGACVR